MTNAEKEEAKERAWIENRRNAVGLYASFSLGFDACAEIMRAEHDETIKVLSEAAGLKQVPFKRV